MRRLRLVSLITMSIFYLLAGINHFYRPDFYMQMMPPYVPAHAEAVFFSGVAEVLLAIGLLVPRTRALAAWGVIALLIAVFPANVHMAIHQVPVGDPPVSSWLLWLRLPFQAVLVAWAWWHTQDPDAASPAGRREGSLGERAA